MADLSGVGDLVISVGGDLSPLDSTLQQIPAIAEQAGAALDAAAAQPLTNWQDLEAGINGVIDSLGNLASAAADVQPLEQSFAGLDDAAAQAQADLEGIGAAASTAADSANQLPPAMHDTAQAAAEAESSFSEFVTEALALGGVVLTLEALKEAVVGSIEAFAEFQRVGESLVALTHDAEGAASALEEIPALADKLGQSIPSLEEATQQFALYGVQLEAIPGLLESIANASVASGRDFDSVASSFERLVNTGVLMQRSLQQTGLNIQDIAQAMNMAGASSQDVIKAFKDLGDGAEGAAARAQVMIDATARLGNIAEQTANDVHGSLQQIQNAFHEAAVGVGESLALLGGGEGLDLVKTAIKAVETFIVSLIGYVGQAIDVLTGLYHIALDVITGIAQAVKDAASGNFTQAWTDLKNGVAAIGDEVHQTWQKMSADWQANGKIIDGIWTDTAGKVKTGSDSMRTSIKAVGDAAVEVVPTLTLINNALDKLSQARTDQAFDAMVKSLDDLRNGAAIAAQNIQFLLQQDLDLVETTDLLGQSVSRVVDSMDMMAGIGDQVNAALQQQAAETMNLDSAFKALGMTADDVKAKELDMVGAAYDYVLAAQKVGAATQNEVNEAFQGYVDAVGKIIGSNNQLTTSTQQVASDWDKAAKQINQAVEKDMSKAFSDLITGTGNVSQAFAKMGSDILAIVLDTIIKRALAPLLASIDSVVQGLMASFGAGGVAETVTKNTAQEVQNIGTKTVSSISQMGSAATSMLGGIFNMVTGFIGALGSIFSAIELAHTNTLLGRIEVSTRRMDVAMEQQPQSLLWSGQKTVEYLGYAVGDLDLLKTTTLMLADVAQNQLSALNQIVANTAIAAAGGGGGGGGGTNEKLIQQMNMLQDSVTKLESTVTALSTDVSGSYGLGAQVQGIGTSVQNLSSTSHQLTTATDILNVSANTLSSTVASVGAVVQNAAAVTGAAAVATVAAVQSAGLSVPGAGAIGSSLVSTVNVPQFGTTPGAGAGNAGYIASHPWEYGLTSPAESPSIVNMNVNLSGATVVGQDAANNLGQTVANAMVGKFATMGIRLTRQ